MLTQDAENAFGIWASRFCVFLSRCKLQSDNVVWVALAAIVLLNMLHEKSSESCSPPSYFDEEINSGGWRADVPTDVFCPGKPGHANNCSKHTAEQIREMFADYLYSSEIISQIKHMKSSSLLDAVKVHFLAPSF